MYVLAWHSYDAQENKLNGSIIGVYFSLDKAKSMMQQVAQDTIQYQENLEDAVIVQRNNLSIDIRTDNEYYAYYYIEGVTIPESKETKYEEALMQISKLGSVCDDFELCKHKACTDSAGAVLIALEALKDA